jgi:hypothetical protein
MPIGPSDIEPESGKKYFEICDRCNYDRHYCHFCGDSLTHDDYDSGGNLHDAKFCRPDLFEHEIGDTCTRPGVWCYWDHENNKLAQDTAGKEL